MKTRILAAVGVILLVGACGSIDLDSPDEGAAAAAKGDGVAFADAQLPVFLRGNPDYLALLAVTEIQGYPNLTAPQLDAHCASRVCTSEVKLIQAVLRSSRLVNLELMRLVHSLLAEVALKEGTASREALWPRTGEKIRLLQSMSFAGCTANRGGTFQVGSVVAEDGEVFVDGDYDHFSESMAGGRYCDGLQRLQTQRASLAEYLERSFTDLLCQTSPSVYSARGILDYCGIDLDASTKWFGYAQAPR